MSYVPSVVHAETEEPNSLPASPTRSQAPTGTRSRTSAAELALKGRYFLQKVF